ncbi:S8 family serine peptidase [Nonomuraea sp. NBC_00507]|uniref:S8 family serine peptidase n=1 Tax=Nonomuraea sp. NBC_00507 TaxID=2976002 RepID=UPI002E1A006F
MLPPSLDDQPRDPRHVRRGDMVVGKSPGRRWSAALALTGLMATGIGAPAAAESGAEEQKTYIVQMALDPVVTYDGEVGGLTATKPKRGEKIDPQSAAVSKYVEHVKGRHDAALKKVGGGKKLYEYVYSYEGFAAQLTKSQAVRLRAMPDVVAVTEDKKVSAATDSTPAFLGLDARGGLWDQLGGTKDAGEDLVIGVIDSGIWPGGKSFADPDVDGKKYHRLRGFRGTCESGADDSWSAGACNGKLVAARHYNAGFGGDEAIKEALPWEFLSPRDYNGHGTHVAATAAGNHGVPVTGAASAFGTVSGIAPRARIAAYKALWSEQDGSTAYGNNSDLVAAIDQAVADGVDVINYSVSGTSSDFLDPVEVAFLAAAEAGVFVAAAGGNDGPTASTVAHPSPWITTVAAGTHNRVAQGTVTLGNGTAYSGTSVTGTKAGPAPLVDATAVGVAGADPVKATQCWAAKDNNGKAVLDPAKVKGKIVICDRGQTPRVNKSAAVAEAGGIGMIMTNVDENTVDTDLHLVPTVHLAVKDRQAVKDYAAAGDATATIEQAKIIADAPAPYVAAFSSRGPLTAGNGAVLKPDVTAPGQDILAAVAPPGRGGHEFGLSSGTSMASPHVAGLAALLKDRHRDWSPMAIKSALMTSARDVLAGAHPFAQGAGHVAPNSAADPGLVYDSDINDWIAFLCGTTKGVKKENCDTLAGTGHSLAPGDLNTPSITVSRMNGPAKVTREVTNVGRSTTTYTASVSGLDGITAKVTPGKLTLRPGETKSFTVEFTRAAAPMGAYQSGQLTWKDDRHTVRVPVLVRPVPETWAATYGVAMGRDSAELIALDPKGKRVYVTGMSYGQSPGQLKPVIATVAYDAGTGEELWSKTYTAAGIWEEAHALEVSPDGGKLFVIGDSTGTETGNDAVTIAYDTATGDEVWVARHTGTADASSAGDSGNAAAVSPDGKSIYVAGMTTLGESADSDYFTVAYDVNTGQRQWLAHYDAAGPHVDTAGVIAVTPDGSKVFVSGQSSGEESTGLSDWGTVAYDASTGRQLWTARHDGPAHGGDVPSAMAVSGTSVFITGSSVDPGTQTDMTTIAYDIATGKEVWADRYDGPAHGSDNAQDITVVSGKVYVTGNTEGVGTGSDFTTIAYDAATGQRSWTQRHNGKAGNEDTAWDVAVTPDGGKVVITGHVGNEMAVGTDYVTMAYDAATGTPVWTGNYDGAIGAADSPSALAVDADAEAGVRIFVTGSTATGGFPPDMLDMDFGTVAYFEPWKTP